MKSNLKIEWLTKSLDMFNAFNSKIKSTHVRGGRVYELLAIAALKNSYVVSINEFFIKRSNILDYFFQNHKSKIIGDICVVDPYIVALGKFNSKKKNIAIIHHLDLDLFSKNILSKFFYYNLTRNLKKMDSVVVVSELWKSYLNKIGVKQIKVIYNAFDIKSYVFSKEDKDSFKKKYQLIEGKPIVFLGPNSHGKGVNEILNVIDEQKYELIATGKVAVENKNVKTFFFSEEEFPLFLACCDVVLCMSTMTEGWNRIAHEALLAKTPVIGSGTGGMQELLEKSGQIIVKEFDLLNENIERCLKNSDYYITSGYNYTSKFDLDYFQSCWDALIETTEL
jgi:glycosyltransferase involved in cell wall biosynthesis